MKRNWTAKTATTPKPAKLPKRTAPAIAILLAATACGGGSSNDQTDVGTGGGAADEAASADQPEFGSHEFGLSWEELAIRIENVEASIGTCMADAGFDYVPVDFDGVTAAMGADGTAPGVSDDDYLAQYGFGISTRVGEPDPVIAASRGPQNQAIFDGLAATDQVAYSRSLLGENVDATFARALEDEDFSETGGCTRAAVEEFFSEEELSASYVNPGDAQLESDPRLVEALSAWSDCMADEGYQYGHPDDVEDGVRDEFDAVVGDGDPTNLSATAAAALTELQGFERAVAAVATSCEEDIVDPVVEQIETEIYGSPQS